MFSRSKRGKRIDGLIRTLSNTELVHGLNRRELPPERLRQLGDLYLQKGDARRAIAYLYRAADGFREDFPMKSLALYKKILHVAPHEMEACEKIVGILASAGLVAEQIKYLRVMGAFYESRNNVAQTTRAFRRILDLDPDNPTALAFFGRGKVAR